MSLKYHEYNAARNKLRFMAARFADALICGNPTMAANQEKDLKDHAALLRKHSELRMALEEAEVEVRESIKGELHDRQVRRQLRAEEKRRQELKITDG